MKQGVTLNEVAGYVTEKNIWKLILDLSSSGNNLCQCSPEQIEVGNGQFLFGNGKKKTITVTPFAPPEGHIGEAAEVWALGAVAFYALMGVAVLEGKGGEKQTDGITVPRIGSAHCSPMLSDIIFRCLSYSPSARPTMAQIRDAAAERFSLKEQPPKQLSLSSGKKYGSSLVKFWPEEMCSLLALLFLLLFSPSSMAQSPRKIPAEMDSLVLRCKALRNVANQSKVKMGFTRDSLWTLMDELTVDRQGECTIKDKVKTLKLNDLCYRLMKLQTGVTNTGSRFRNGMDRCYNYSFIEVTAKKGSRVSYDITGRSGKQIFAIVPYNDKSTLRVSLTRNGKHCVEEQIVDHVTYLFVNEAVSSNDVLHLMVENLSKEHISFVIINYNSRNR